MHRVIFIVVSALVIGCATTKSEAPGPDAQAKKPEPEPERMIIVNNVNFDIAACTPRPLENLPLNDRLLSGVLLSARPQFNECLVDSKSRKDAASTEVTVSATVAEAAATFEATGANLSDSGKACIEAAGKRLGLTALSKGSPAVTAKITLTHNANNPSVQWGVNIASDIVATLRLSQLSWCECYSDVGVNPPPPMQALVKLSPTTPIDIAMKAGDDTLTSKIASCVLEKMKKTELPTVDRPVEAPFNFLLLNSNAALESPDVTPQLQFFQVDAIRLARETEVELAAGRRKAAVLTHEALGKKYKKPTPAQTKDLKEKCDAIVDADDQLISAYKTLISTFEHLKEIAARLKVKDAAFGAAETALGQHITFHQGELAKADEQKKGDANACSKR